MTKFSDFIRNPGTAGPPTLQGIYALGFALRSEITTLLGKFVRVDQAQSFTGPEKTQGRDNLGLGTMATQDANAVTITGGSITGVTGFGTMATQDANAVAITGGSITGITDLAIADGGTGASNAATARTNLGLGTMATQDANAVAITGGSITGVSGFGAPTMAVARLTDTKAQNTAAQSLTATTWNKRQINTENYDPSNIVTIASDQFTLAAGSDYLVTAVVQAPADGSSASTQSVRFFNATDATPRQNMGYAQNLGASQVTQNVTIVDILPGGKTYEVQQYPSGNKAAGNPANIAGMSEVYLTIVIIRLTNSN